MKLTTAADVTEELAADPKSVLMFMGARYFQGSDKQHIEIIFKKELLESLNMNGKARVLEALQKAAEYVAASMGSSSGASGVA